MFVALTQTNGDTCYVNSGQVQALQTVPNEPGHSRVAMLGGWGLIVQGTPAEVLAKLEDADELD